MSLAQAGLESFEEYLSRVNLAGARLAYTLAAILVPLTWGLDWVSAPHLVWEFLAIRLGTSALALGGLALCHTRALQRHPVALGAGAPVLCAMAIEAMILLHEGPASPYYAGLNLCILAVAVLYTWRWQRSLLISGVVVALWLVPALPILLLGGLEYRAFFNNLVFLVDTAAIAVASAVIRYRSAAREHQVRTELAGLSEELADALEKLQDNDRLKNEFFANVSHELRTPLTLILSPVEDLLTKTLDTRVAESLRMVRRNAQRLLRLIDDLLDLARLDGQGLRLNVAQVGLSGLAERVADVARPAAEAKDVTLSVECEGHVTIYGDPHRLEIVLTNLVGNALKFTPRGGKIAIRVESADDGVRLSVADTGPGIAEADLDRIFQRFYQVGGASGRSQGGAGIGLPLARSLARLHGGDLTVKSRLGHGSVFELFLLHGTDHFDPEVIERRRVKSERHPGRRTEDSQAPPQLPMTTVAEPLDSPPVSETFPLTRGRRPRVLVVEDEKDLRDFIVEILAQHFEVLTATDGRHGMDRIRSERPDLVITDMMMPVMSGTELCRAVKQDPSLRVTPVILLTARSGAESTLDGYSSGADDFISKPFHTRVLLARVRAQLKLRALGLQLADQSRLTAASALAAGIAHEVKNPLNAVLNATRVLPKVGVDTTTGAKLMQTIEEGALRIGDIVSVLEDHVRPADGAEKSVCDINTGIESTLRLLEFKLKGISVHYDPAARHQVVASGRELNQVILNLLDNAAMAEPHNVWVDVSRVGQDVVVDISDDGSGVPSEFAKLIFEPFFTTRGSGKGTGLGLYLARRVVTDYGGDLSYHPRPGGGSKFSLRLPAMSPDVSGAVGRATLTEPIDPALNASR